MTVRARSWLTIFVGIGIAFWARWIDPCAWKNGPCPGHVSMLMLIAFVTTFWFGVLPLVNRWFWVVFKGRENEFYLRRWRKSFDGPFGEFWEWLLGMDRDGNLRP